MLLTHLWQAEADAPGAHARMRLQGEHVLVGWIAHGHVSAWRWATRWERTSEDDEEGSDNSQVYCSSTASSESLNHLKHLNHLLIIIKCTVIVELMTPSYKFCVLVVVQIKVMALPLGHRVSCVCVTINWSSAPTRCSRHPVKTNMYVTHPHSLLKLRLLVIDDGTVGQRQFICWATRRLHNLKTDDGRNKCQHHIFSTSHPQPSESKQWLHWSVRMTVRVFL